MSSLNFIFDPTSPTFSPVASSAAKAQGSDANVDTKATTTQLDAALAYARSAWAVLPVGTDKRPLTAHGLHDATADEAVILQMWGRWPSALIGVATGRVSGVIALDIDVRPSGSGFDSLADLGLVVPDAPTARTPSGGLHFFFQAPNHNVRNSASKIGPLVDVRGDGGYIIVPPGPGRSWDPIKNLDTTALPPMPEWLVAPPRVKLPPPPQRRPAKPPGQLSAYGEAALDNAVRRIISAGAGVQEVTLNTEVYCIGALVSGGEIPEALGLDAMVWAARKMPSFDAYRQWRAAALELKVRKAFDDGMANPKAAPNV